MSPSAVEKPAGCRIIRGSGETNSKKALQIR